jgi:glycosyltransferase involved in cell wall biosynthesis
MLTHTPSCLPLVSVVIPAYNAEEFLAETLESVIAQTYDCLEILVINDGSTDRTVDIVEQAMASDRRLTLITQPNAGAAAARNTGFNHAQGDYVAPIDADDLWHPQAIEKMVACMQQAPPTVGVVYAWSADVDGYGKVTGGFRTSGIQGNVYITLICHNFLGNASASLIRRTYLQQVGGYRTDMQQQKAHGCEDWDMYLRLAEICEFRVVKEFLVGYRKDNRSMSTDFTRMARSHQLMLRSVQEKHPEIPTILYQLSASSFYLYLARVCYLYTDFSNTLVWLGASLKATPVITLCRLGFYSLGIKSLLRLALPRWRYVWLRQRDETSEVAPGQSFDAALKSVGVTPHNRKVRFQQLVGRVLHGLMKRVFGGSYALPHQSR